MVVVNKLRPVPPLHLQGTKSLTKNTLLDQSSSSAAASSFRIITGAGNNSPQMKSVLQPKVIALLNKEGWKWEYDHRTLSHADGIGRAGGVTVVGIVEKKAY